MRSYVANALAVAIAETCDGFEVCGQVPGQTHQFHVALLFAFQAPIGLDAVEVTIEVELEQHECVNYPYRVVLGDEIVQAPWQQRDLLPVLADNKSRKIETSMRYVKATYRKILIGFSHTLAAHLPHAFSPLMSAMWICRDELKGCFMELRLLSGEHHLVGSMAGIRQAFR